MTSCNMHDSIFFLFFIAGSIGKGSKAPGWKGGQRTTGGVARLEVKKIAVIIAAAVDGVIIMRNLPTAKPGILTLVKISLRISSKVSYFLASFLPCCDKQQCSTGMPAQHLSLCMTRTKVADGGQGVLLPACQSLTQCNMVNVS